MNIDLAALPDDVETLQKLVRSLAAERTSLRQAQAEIERLKLIIKKLQRSQSERLDDDCYSAPGLTPDRRRRLTPSNTAEFLDHHRNFHHVWGQCWKPMGVKVRRLFTGLCDVADSENARLRHVGSILLKGPNCFVIDLRRKTK
jgi:hypothetical protein